MLDKVVLAYSSNDFFYYSVKDDLKMCDSSGYTNLPSCETATALDNTGLGCTAIELCKNQKNAKWVADIQEKHSGADERYLNTKDIYNVNYASMINLGIGILFSISYIYKYK